MVDVPGANVDEGQVLFRLNAEHATTLVRTVDLGGLEGRSSEQLLNDMLADIFPTQVFVSDSLGQTVDQLVLCGFGEYLEPALELFPKELGCPTKALQSKEGPVPRR